MTVINYDFNVEKKNDKKDFDKIDVPNFLEDNEINIRPIRKFDEIDVPQFFEEDTMKKQNINSIDELDVPKFFRNSCRIGTLPKDSKLTGKKQNMKNAEIKRKKMPMKAKKRIAALITATSLSIAGVVGVAQYINKDSITGSQPIAQENVLVNEQDILEENNEWLKQIEDMQVKLNFEDISTFEMIELSKKANKLQMEVLKTKLANGLNTNSAAVKIYPTDRDCGARVVIERDGYSKSNSEKSVYLNDLLQIKNKLSNEIAGSIDDISEVQDYIANSLKGDINRRQIKYLCNNSLKKTTDLVKKDVIVDKHGNLKLEKNKEYESDKDNER